MYIVGTISDVELSKSQKNKKGKRIGFSGIIIEIETNDSLIDDSYIEIDVDGRKRPFVVDGITTKTNSELNSILIRAKETGYFANRLSHNKDFDIRSLLGLQVSLVTDVERIKKIKESSFYC